MSYAKALAVGLVGLAGHVVEVEADLATGLPGLTLTGLPDPAVSEARARVRAATADPGDDADLADVVGQELGRRGLEVAAAGGHHLFLVGPPGAGKTMLARRLPSILPPLSDAAALEVAAVHSIAGALPPGAPM